MEVPLYQRHRRLSCTDLVISEQGSTLAYAVTERSETGKSNDLCSSEEVLVPVLRSDARS
jgi:hypothetical protein